MLGDALAVLEELTTGFASIFVRRHGLLPTCFLFKLLYSAV
jgi:hypothetical protein